MKLRIFILSVKNENLFHEVLTNKTSFLKSFPIFFLVKLSFLKLIKQSWERGCSVFHEQKRFAIQLTAKSPYRLNYQKGWCSQGKQVKMNKQVQIFQYDQ